MIFDSPSNSEIHRLNGSDEVAANTPIATSSRNEAVVHASIPCQSTSEIKPATQTVDMNATMINVKKTEFDKIFDDLTDALSRLRIADHKCQLLKNQTSFQTYDSDRARKLTIATMIDIRMSK